MDDEGENKFVVQSFPERHYIEVKLSGFFTEGDMAKFLEALVAERAKLDPDLSKRRTLYDVSEFRMQAQDTVEAFAAMIADPSNQPGRLAVYVGDAAVRMQVNRVVHKDSLVATDIEAAQKWLWQEG
jgi:hypothetical protein